MSENASSVKWEEIKQGMTDVEKLIGQKDYNASMVRSRMTLELMVKSLAETNDIDGTLDLSSTIDELYEKKIVSGSTRDHYHKIRLIGNKAVHNNDTNAYNANTAYHLLSQEVYIFANSYSSGKKSRMAKPVNDEEENIVKRRLLPTKGSGSSSELIFKIAIPVLIVIILIALIKLISGGKETKVDETPAQTMQVVMATVSPQETVPPTIPVPKETVPAVEYYTNDYLKVRSTPDLDTTNSNVLKVLDPDTKVIFIDDYDDFWAAIDYEGSTAYVAKEYLTAK